MLEEGGAPNNEGVVALEFGAAKDVDAELPAPKLKLELDVAATEDFEANVADIEGKLAEVVTADG